MECVLTDCCLASVFSL